MMNRLNIKLIVSDIDGTLLTNGKPVSRANIDAIAACRARGVEFVVASGRWYPSALNVARQLGIQDGYMIICNGGAVVKCDGSVLMERGLSAQQAKTVHQILQKEKVMMTSYVRGGIYRMRSRYLSIFHLPELGGFFCGEKYDVLDEDADAFLASLERAPYKMEAYCDDCALLAKIRAELEATGLQVNSSFPFNLEIMPSGSGKGAAVRWLTAHLGLECEQVMGFGDYTNDLPMLKNVGWPVAVGNALDEVKRACRIIAPDCADDGVAKTIQKYILGDETP